MRVLLQSSSLLLFIFQVVAANSWSCRQCVGGYHFVFSVPISEAKAREFLSAGLLNCATANQYDITQTEKGLCDATCVRPGMPPNCAPVNAPLCREWFFHLKVWRYCGNGGKVFWNKDPHCTGNICTSADTLSLSCYASVNCIGKCNCKLCGC